MAAVRRGDVHPIHRRRTTHRGTEAQRMFSDLRLGACGCRQRLRFTAAMSTVSACLARQTEALRTESHWLRRDDAQLQMERDILRKATAFAARASELPVYPGGECHVRDPHAVPCAERLAEWLSRVAAAAPIGPDRRRRPPAICDSGRVCRAPRPSCQPAHHRELRARASGRAQAHHGRDARRPVASPR
jgi:hypothetical protein